MAIENQTVTGSWRQLPDILSGRTWTECPSQTAEVTGQPDFRARQGCGPILIWIGSRHPFARSMVSRCGPAIVEHRSMRSTRIKPDGWPTFRLMKSVYSM